MIFCSIQNSKTILRAEPQEVTLDYSRWGMADIQYKKADLKKTSMRIKSDSS